MEKQRRDFFKNIRRHIRHGIAPGACTSLEVDETIAVEPVVSDSSITNQTLLEAEKLTGVSYTEAEREQIVPVIHEQVDKAKTNTRFII